MTTIPETIGELLPEDLRANYSAAVLDLSLKTAYGIVEEGDPNPPGFTNEDRNALEDIFEKYQSAPVWTTAGDDTPYWNKSKDDNEAFWNKNQ